MGYDLVQLCPGILLTLTLLGGVAGLSYWGVTRKNPIDLYNKMCDRISDRFWKY